MNLLYALLTPSLPRIPLVNNLSVQFQSMFPSFDLSPGPLPPSVFNPELSVCPVPVLESNIERFICPTTLNEINKNLQPCQSQLKDPPMHP